MTPKCNKVERCPEEKSAPYFTLECDCPEPDQSNTCTTEGQKADGVECHDGVSNCNLIKCLTFNYGLIGTYRWCRSVKRWRNVRKVALHRILPLSVIAPTQIRATNVIPKDKRSKVSSVPRG